MGRARNGPRRRNPTAGRRAGARARTASEADAVTFPAEPEDGSGTRLTLPSSGLASDILALAEAAPVVPAAPAAPAAPAPAAAADEPVTARSHNISFFGSQTREERKAVEASEHLATFFLAGEEYGVDVRLVQEIIRVSEITQVPRAPQFVKGVINLRGRIVPVIDLKRKLELGEVEPTRQSRIVVVKVRDRLMGLLVDGASQVLKVPLSTIEAAPEEVVEIDASYIRGVAKLEARLIILVDLHKILSVELREGPALPPA
ncbi:MAG TPA: chemotaxis protein CheW [Vicinamibacteria bacterium]|jgi:purine-binding chemotaxis protein CheW